ncbi:MAG: MmgE/PrpD family protein, partial [Nitrososphaeraceae archaeon]
MATGATKQLARYAVNLRYRDIPPEVIARAKDCLLDILTVALYGSTKPWSQKVAQFVSSLGLSGRSTLLG